MRHHSFRVINKYESGDVMEWVINNDTPIHEQLIKQLELRIITGIYPIAERLPSVRDLALEARVNPNTMQKALIELERKGLIYTKRTIGKYVANNEAIIIQAKEQMANELTSDFLLNMKKLGFDEKNILIYLTERMSK